MAVIVEYSRFMVRVFVVEVTLKSFEGDIVIFRARVNLNLK